VLSLGFAFFVNAAILVLSASAFHAPTAPPPPSPGGGGASLHTEMFTGQLCTTKSSSRQSSEGSSDSFFLFKHARGHCSALKKPPRHFPLEGSSCPPLGQRSGLFSSLTAKRELSPRRIPGKGGTVPPSGHEGVTEIGDAPRGSRRHITASNHIPLFCIVLSLDISIL